MAQIHDKRRASTGIRARPSGFLLLTLLLLLSVNVPRVVSSNDLEIEQPIREVSTYFKLFPAIVNASSSSSVKRLERSVNSGCGNDSSTTSRLIISNNSIDSPNNNNNKHKDQNKIARLRRMKNRIRRSVSGPIKPYKSYFDYDSLQFRKSQSLDKGSARSTVEQTYETTANRTKSYEPIVKNITFYENIKGSKLIDDEDSVENISGRTYKKAAETTIKRHHESDEQQSDKFYLLRDINGEYEWLSQSQSDGCASELKLNDATLDTTLNGFQTSKKKIAEKRLF